MNKLHWKYLIPHWAITLLIAPFLVQLLMYATRNNAHQIVGLLEIYPLTLLFSFIFSIPTYIICGIADYLYLKRNLNTKVIKIRLISIVLIGILITLLSIFKVKESEIILGYFLTSLLAGITLKLK